MTACAGYTSASISACSPPFFATMKPTLQVRLSQHLTLTPQLQQSIRLLQLSTVELNQEIERILMENPALEREDTDGGEHEAPRSSPSEQVSTPAESSPAEAPASAETDWPSEAAAAAVCSND